MHIRLLGSAAGGGFPQWNCACQNCHDVRSKKKHVVSRFHSSLAFSKDGVGWYLINATPDIRQQLESCPDLHPGPALRATPLRGVFLTDAELDHTLGLFVLREGASLNVWSSESVINTLKSDFPIARILQNYNFSNWNVIDPSQPLSAVPELTIRIYELGNKKPRYVSSPHSEGSVEDSNDWSLGFHISDNKTGGSFFYAPQLAHWSETLQKVIDSSSICFVDGTFFTPTELIDLGASSLPAMSMGHMPLSGADGIIGRLAAVRKETRKILVHINNTNPILSDLFSGGSLLSEHNIERGYDGMKFEI